MTIYLYNKLFWLPKYYLGFTLFCNTYTKIHDENIILLNAVANLGYKNMPSVQHNGHPQQSVEASPWRYTENPKRDPKQDMDLNGLSLSMESSNSDPNPQTKKGPHWPPSVIDLLHWPAAYARS